MRIWASIRTSTDSEIFQKMRLPISPTKSITRNKNLQHLCLGHTRILVPMLPWRY
ncbi:hypothetical protein Golob_004890 [Gossypium lobatum]|uniref:Uncharacterized protein n=1 Tax=Gossypium lobatum TaxID=34289 RepID=A0A7J8N3A5_9ROSI|nr:hypothetical protein [Gossypium lobatum]